MEHPAKMSLKQRARARSILSPESIHVEASAPRLQLQARATSDMVGAVLFPDQVCGFCCFVSPKVFEEFPVEVSMGLGLGGLLLMLWGFSEGL